MIDDCVNKGHTKLNMFSVVGEQIRSLSSKQSKLNFWNQLHPKIAFYAIFWHKQPPDDQTIQFDLNCRCNSESYDRHVFFGTKFRGGQSLLFSVRGFFNIEEFYRSCNFGCFWWIFADIKPTCCTYQNLSMTFTNILCFVLNFVTSWIKVCKRAMT